MLTRARRLPGFRFEVQPPTPTDVLPRMDLAVFVGLAASGPLNRPVVVEDPVQFEAIFGADAPLAWDETRGEMVDAYLAPAVRAFFRNGGRRCWIIRVAGPAVSNYFPIPGLLRAEFDASGQLTRVAPAYAQARSEGSWSDTLSVGAALLNDPIVVQRVSFAPLEFDLALNAPDELALGDLLRFTFRGEGYQLLLVVDSLQARAPDPLDARMTVTVRGTKAIWLQASWAKPPADDTASAQTFTHDAQSAPVAVTVPARPDGGAASPPSSRFDWPDTDQSSQVKLNLGEDLDAAPAPGSLVRVNFGADEFWLRAEAFQATEQPFSPPAAAIQIVGEGLWLLRAAPPVLPTSIPDGERLALELWTRQGQASLLRLSDLGFETRHARFWGALPTDQQLYPAMGVQPEASRAGLWQAAANPRFPLAGADEPNVFYFPLAMTFIPELFLTADRASQTALERDGLGQFDAALFLDDKLRGVGQTDLMAEADFIRYQSPEPRALCGIHAALGIEEATIIAAPDLVQRGWQRANVPASPLPFESPPLPRPAWWHFLDCLPDPDRAAPRAPSGGRYPQAQPGSILAPELNRNDRPEQPGLVILTWSLPTPVDATYVLEEATQPDFEGAAAIYTGPEQQALIYGRVPGDYYYRVRAEANGMSSDWSSGVVVRVPIGTIPLVRRPAPGHFLDCDIVILEPPYLVKSEPDPNGTFALEWASLYSAAYVLEEASARDFNGSVVIYSGADERRTVYGRHAGEYYYRVRALVGGASSDWSNGVVVRVASTTGWRVNSTADYSPETLLSVQRALLRMCAARGDLFALLALPEHYREEAAIAHAAALTAPNLDGIGADDARTFSFGALYHPWTIESDNNTPVDYRRLPPDGAVAGVLAQRAFNRGAWIAPANEALRGVVALTPPISRDRWLDLQQAQINIVRQDPRGFFTLSADTLSSDDDVRPINVRRLLMLLRRLALKLGATYVFEPNDDAFRRSVERGFEALLSDMFVRGAFAGATKAASFKVVADDSVNTPQSIDQGRFIVDLAVAPSHPMTFLTIRLVQTSGRTAVTEAA